jgi:alpha-N-arabinofuranosidase
MVNVLQAMILTHEEKMALKPTCHVFEMFNAHQDAIRLTLDFKTSEYTHKGESVPAVNASASINTNLLTVRCKVVSFYKYIGALKC